MPRAVIHIGANKTGSTTLQRWLFARSDHLLYLGEDCQGYEEYRDVLDSLVHDDDIHYLQSEAEKLFGRYQTSAGNRTFVYSNEDIMRSRVPAQCARRLRKLLPQARILAVIRNQLTAVPSWYANHGAYLRMVPRRYWRRHVPFNEWMEYCMLFLKYSPLDGFFYHRILNLYADLFGKDRIEILLYEDFVNRPRHFINDLCRVIGVDTEEATSLLEGRQERRRNTVRRLRYARLRSRLLWGSRLTRYVPFGRALSKRWQSFLDAGPRVSNSMPDRWQAIVGELYSHDNSLLARNFGLRLADYGYPLDDDLCSSPIRMGSEADRQLSPSMAIAT